MFAVTSLRGIGDIIGRGQAPRTFFAEEGEVLGMVILVQGDDIEHHSAVHLFHLQRVLRKIACQCQQVGIINILFPEIGFQQGRCRCYMVTLAFSVHVEAFNGKILVAHESDPGDGNTGFPGGFHI